MNLILFLENFFIKCFQQKNISPNILEFTKHVSKAFCSNLNKNHIYTDSYKVPTHCFYFSV